MINDGADVDPKSKDSVFALLFVDGGAPETHGIYTSVGRAERAFVSLATAGLIDARGTDYSIEEYPLDQPFAGTVVVRGAELLRLLDEVPTT